VAFSSFPFLLVFLPLVLGGFAVAGRFGEAWAKRWLIAASLLFYAAGARAFLPLLVLSVAGNFLLVRAMCGAARAGWWAGFGVAVNLAVLGWFKYWDPQPALGLSFFTFTQIACLLHHAGGDVKPPRARDYTLYAAFFPALLAGPILNPREMLPQLARDQGWRLTAADLAVGGGFFVVGLVKKTVLADPLGSVVGPAFEDPWGLGVFGAWQAAMAYSLQLYFDFSGYTDMAIGLAWMVGLRFPDNFDQPYRARSVTDYWQRWHMSLTRLLMTTVHGPLTLSVLRWRRRLGLRVDARAQATVAGFASMIGAPIVVTMVLISLWHGATWPFLVFGLLHAGFLLVNHGWRVWRMPALPAVLGVVATYLCVLVGAVVFRAETLGQAGALLAGMVGVHGVGDVRPDLSAMVAGLWLAGLYGVVWLAPTTRQFVLGEASGRFGWRATPGWAVVMGCAACLGLLAAGGTGEFLYFRF
jgi:alginate O-acetyltransferase complex protein AlgI